MTTIAMKSTVLAVVPETTPGTPKGPTAGTDYTIIQGDLEMQPSADVLQNAELRATLDEGKPILGAENPSGSMSRYMRGSGVEGQAPDFNELLKSALGTEVVAGTEYTAAASSTTSLLKVGSGNGTHFQRGQGFLVKHATHPWEVNVVESVSGDDITPMFKFKFAPAAGTALGKCVLYKPAESGHQTLTLRRYLGNGGAHETIAGCLVTGLSIAAGAGQLINGKFSFAALSHMFNGIEIGATDIYLDFKDGVTAYAAAVEARTYKDPHELAEALEAAMNAAHAADVHTATYSDTTGKFTFTSANATFELLWNTGTNAANSIGDKIGFSVAADDTGAQTYTSDNAISFASPYTPTLDATQPVAAKGGVCYLGDQADNVNFESAAVNIDWSFDRGVNQSVCAESGNSSALITARKLKISVSSVLVQYDASKYARYRKGTRTKFLYVWGPKNGGNPVAGETMYMATMDATITSVKITEANGLAKIDIELAGYAGTTAGTAYLGQQ